MELNWVDIAVIVVAVLGLIFGGTFAVKYRHGIKLLEALGEAFTETAKALEDKKLTKGEAIDLLAKWQSVFFYVMVFTGKK